MIRQQLAESSVAAESLSRSFGADQAVGGVDLVVLPGEVHAVIGLNGAGKTTLMRLLLGMLRPDSGRALILGCDVRQADGDVWCRVGHLIEARFGYPELTAAENLQAAGRLYGLSRAAAGPAAERLIERLRLTRWADRPARALSAGNRQRLGLGCAMICDPLVLILDEPISGLDPAGVVLVRQLLNEAAVRGTAILLSSHHLDEMSRTADYIHVMHRGRLVGSLEPHGVDLERRFFEMILAIDEAEPEPSR
jgi:ABC-2 type transport system ATP-binding protein